MAFPFNPRLRWQVWYLQYRLKRLFDRYELPLPDGFRIDGRLGPVTRETITIAKRAMGWLPAFATADREPALYRALKTYGGSMTAEQRARGVAFRHKYRAAKRTPYPNLRGDLDADPAVLAKAQACAAERGEVWTVTSGRRSYAEQKALWDSRHSNPYPVAYPGTSRHETGRALDVIVNGRAIQNVVPAHQLRRHGLEPLAGDAVHIEG